MEVNINVEVFPKPREDQIGLDELEISDNPFQTPAKCEMCQE